MSHAKPALLLPRQFCRQWDGRRVGIKFLSELTERERALLELQYGEHAVASLPAHILRTLDARARRALARSFGRSRVELLKQRRERERAQYAASHRG